MTAAFLLMRYLIHFFQLTSLFVASPFIFFKILFMALYIYIFLEISVHLNLILKILIKKKKNMMVSLVC